jgi:hypothetical protein
MIHGKNTHQLQVLSSLNAGVLDKEELQAIIDRDGWSYLFDQDLFSNTKDQPIWIWRKYPWNAQKAHMFPTKSYHLTMRSPHSIHIPLLTGAFSRSIEQALAKKSRSESEIKNALGLSSDQDISAGIKAIRTLEDYTRYRHFQMLGELYQELLVTGGCISFREFIQDQYQHREILNLGLPPLRIHAIRRAVWKNLKDPNAQVFGIQGNDDDGVNVHEMNGTWNVEMAFQAFIVLNKASNGPFNLKILETLKTMNLTPEATPESY